MKTSLIIKLLGAFLIVILIGALVVAILTSQATQSAFDLYMTRSGQVWGTRLAPYLAEYYSLSDSWEGVDSYLESGLSTDLAGVNDTSSPGQGQGRGQTSGRQFFGMSQMITGQRLILIDANGTVLSDSSKTLIGRQFSEADVQSGVPIIIETETVGTLFVIPEGTSGTDTLAGEFLSSVNKAIINSAVISSLLALLLGALAINQIVRPLRQLNAAASAIARGKFNQRVEIRSKDELGQLGDTFNSMTESLSRSEELRRNLAADIAHELRTPLSAIQGTLEGIQDGVFPMDTDQVSALYAETTLLNRLIGDLRLLSLAEAGQLSLDRQATRLDVLLNQVSERTRPSTELKGVHLEIDVQPDMDPVFVDQDRMTQVVTNLIGNAVRYTAAGGTILVKAFVNDGNEVSLSVSDTGTGIAPQDLPYIFDRFYRADKSRSRGSGGSGLGLAIARQMVEMHGGTIQAESPIFTGDSGNRYGTRITINLPIFVNHERETGSN